jgi:hypothetical protein
MARPFRFQINLHKKNLTIGWRSLMPRGPRGLRRQELPGQELPGKALPGTEIGFSDPQTDI